MKPSIESAPNGDSLTTLGYAPRAPLLRRRRVRRVIAVLCVIVVAAAGWKWGPTARDRLAMLHWQRQCMEFDIPPDVQLHEPNPNNAVVLARANPNYFVDPTQGGVALFHPRCQRNFKTSFPAAPVMMHLMSAGSQYSPVTLFLHEMKTPSGKKRLVIVEGTTVVNLYAPAFDIDYRVYEPGTLWSTPRRVNRDYGKSFSGRWDPASLGPGTIDPADSGHFTLSYASNGQSWIIDARLMETNDIRFSVRDGPGRQAY